MVKFLIFLLKGVKNIAILGFLLSYVLPVEENIPFGFMAAISSLTEALEDKSWILFWGFMPNLLMSYLIFRSHTVKSWNPAVIIIYAVVTYWGVLLWLDYPVMNHVRFWEADTTQTLFTLLPGYWLWHLSILFYISVILFENMVHKLSAMRHLRKAVEQVEEEG